MPSGNALRALVTLALAALVGVACGGAAWLFLTLLGAATAFRVAHEAVVFALPVVGLVAGAAYERFGGRARGGTPLVLATAREPGPWLPRRMAPLVLVGTVLTHLFGGSAGREGTAVQMGGGLADTLARALRVDASTRRALLFAGIAGGFGAVFGTPLAGAAFAFEATGARREPNRWLALSVATALVAAFVGDRVAHACGVTHTAFPRVAAVAFSPLHLGRLALFAAAIAVVAALFVALLSAAKAQGERWLPSLPLRMAAGGAIVVALWRIADGGVYLGLSVPLAVRAFTDASLPETAFAWKTLFTVVTIGAGFVGGEVTPFFVVGATLGNVLARALVLPLDLGAGLGLAALFGSASRAPVALAIMGGELLGWSLFPHALIVGGAASALLGGRTLYPSAKPSS
jgi:H+/Cl- antiporter ClcA